VLFHKTVGNLYKYKTNKFAQVDDETELLAIPNDLLPFYKGYLHERFFDQTFEHIKATR
jgi:hypothetical protein